MGENLQTYCLKNGLDHLLKEWHPTKNGNLKPTDVTAGSNKKVYWLLPYDDVKTGKHYEFEWQAVIQSRVNGSGCPYLSGHKVLQGFNDLYTTHPELAKEWHPTKNGNLKPFDVTSKSTKKVWWYLPYDDPKTNKHFNFEWEAIIENRTKGNKCPFLSGRSAWHGFNDLATIYPEIAKEWHTIKNGKLKPTEVTVGSKKEIWWMNSEGKEWEARICDRTRKFRK